MKIQIDNIVRDMTEEEEAAYMEANTETNEAGPEDYESALAEMGVDFND